jgi:hypothetical protein
MTTKIAPEKLAALVSNVTQTMCGLSFSPTGTFPAFNPHWRTAALTIEGPKPVMVALSADPESCSAIGEAMFGCPADELEPGVIEDVLRELVNMTAGQVKQALSMDDALGLPSMMTEIDVMQVLDRPTGSNTSLKAGGVKLVLWVGPRT